MSDSERHYITEEERANIRYVLPTDDDESSRLLKQHYAVKYAQKGNFQAPLVSKLRKGIKVLDSACGPASWTLEMAKEFPNSTFYGVDMADHDFSRATEELKNFNFSMGDLLKGLPYEDNTFDYVYQRLLFLGLDDEGWTKVLSELLRVLKPGGYIELLEPDIEDYVNLGLTMRKVQGTLVQALKSKGIRPAIGTELKGRLENAGFVNQVQNKMYFNMNHTDLSGQLLWEDFATAANRLQPLFAYKDPKMADPKVFEEEMKQCGKEAKEGKALAIWYDYYAQKPE